MGSLSTSSATALSLTGSNLYVIDGSQFKIVNVSNPAAPLLLSATDNYGAQGLDTTTTYVTYLASPTKGLYVVDVSIPASPEVLANCYGVLDNNAVAVSGSLGVATANSLGMKVVDLSNPLAPKIVGSLSGTMKNVAITGQFAYVLQTIAGNPSHTDLIVVDLGVPATPTIRGQVNVTPSITVDVKVVGSLAYVAAGSAGLVIVDVSTPTAPTIIGTLDTPGTASGVAVANGYAYVADGTAIKVINVSSPRTPTLVASLTTSATDDAVAGNRLYVIDGGLQFKIVDVSMPAAPALLSTWNGLGSQGLDVAGNLAFLATPAINHSGSQQGVYILDVTDPTQVKQLEQIYVPGTTRSVVATPTFVYAGDSSSIIDVIQP